MSFLHRLEHAVHKELHHLGEVAKNEVKVIEHLPEKELKSAVTAVKATLKNVEHDALDIIHGDIRELKKDILREVRQVIQNQFPELTALGSKPNQFWCGSGLV